jgi:multidrug efflux system membrane fusion protein
MDAMGASGAVSQQELMRARALAEAAAARVDAARRREAAAVAQAGEGVAAEQSAEDAIREAESVLAEADARVTAAVAVAAQAEAAIEAARLDVEFCTIRSPLVGRAGERLVDVGDIVTANVTPLLSIQRVDPCYVELSVTEQDLAAVQRALAKGAVTAQVRLPDETGEGRSGPVTFLDNQVRDATGTVRLRVTLENADRRFWPGRFVRVRVVTEILVGAVLVPASAPQVSASGPFVYVVRPDGTAELRPATPGQRQGDLVVIERGVAAGERVVVEGQVGVMPGGAVRVIEPSPPPAPGAAPGAMR